MMVITVSIVFAVTLPAMFTAIAVVFAPTRREGV